MSYTHFHTKPYSSSSTHSQTSYRPLDHRRSSLGEARPGSMSSQVETRSPQRDRGGNLTFGSACTRCRSSKTKCDGINPTCSRCAKYGKTCSYSTPKRRVYPNSVSSRTPRSNSPVSTSSQASHPLLVDASIPPFRAPHPYMTPSTTSRSPLPPTPPASDTSSERRNSLNWGQISLYPFPAPYQHQFRDRSSSLWSLASTATSLSVHSVPSHGRPISPPQYHTQPPPSYRDDAPEREDSLTLAPFADPTRALGSRTRLPGPTRLFPGLKTFAVRECESQWDQVVGSRGEYRMDGW